MELTYKALKEAIEETYTDKYKPSRELILLKAAEAYLPILLRQEFVKPNEVTTDEYLGKNFK